jgi:hypothetical protein
VTFQVGAPHGNQRKTPQKANGRYAASGPFGAPAGPFSSGAGPASVESFFWRDGVLCWQHAGGTSLDILEPVVQTP